MKPFKLTRRFPFKLWDLRKLQRNYSFELVTTLETLTCETSGNMFPPVGNPTLTPPPRHPAARPFPALGHRALAARAGTGGGLGLTPPRACGALRFAHHRPLPYHAYYYESTYYLFTESFTKLPITLGTGSQVTPEWVPFDPVRSALLSS